MSDAATPDRAWSTDALLTQLGPAPAFARTSWDAVKRRSFGAWQPASLTPAPSDPGQDDRPENLAPVAEEEPAPAPEVDPHNADTPSTAISEAALTQLREQAFQEGLLQGRAQHQAEIAAVLSQERELIRQLGLELKSISQDPQRFFEPLKRLSLHLAEQLVRAELKLSGQAIHGLVQSCIQQLDHPTPPVQVSLHPHDLQRLQAMGEAVTAHMQLEPDPQLRPGSVRVRVQDSVVQDLIENRLEPLVRRLLPDPEAWMQNSSLVQDRAEPLPDTTPKRDWNRPVIDVQDTEVKPSPSDDDGTP